MMVMWSKNHTQTFEEENVVKNEERKMLIDEIEAKKRGRKKR